MRLTPAPGLIAPGALMAGNIAMGMSVLAPAGMLPQISQGLDVTIRDAGLLVTYGAVILCVGSPLIAWVTSRIERRVLLAGVLALLGLFNLLSALTPNYPALVALRVVMMIGGAVYTPQAAGAVGLIVPEARRASTISFVFLGWSMAVAFGLPIATFLAATFGWRATYALVGVLGLVTALGVALAMPRGVYGSVVSSQTWRQVFANSLIMRLLAVTTLATAGQFGIFIYLGPLLIQSVDAGPREIATAFMISGVMGLIGNVIASRAVVVVGAFRTTLMFLSSVLLGTIVWVLGAGLFPVIALSMVFFGLGFAAVNSMQQGRLIAAAPPLAGASVALNTSSIYIGQALGSALAAISYANGHAGYIGPQGVIFVTLALMVLWQTRPRAEQR